MTRVQDGEFRCHGSGGWCGFPPDRVLIVDGDPVLACGGHGGDYLRGIALPEVLPLAVLLTWREAERRERKMAEAAISRLQVRVMMSRQRARRVEERITGQADLFGAETEKAA